MGKLKGKTAVITGGTTGIGFSTAKLFMAEGAKVAITGRNDDTLNEARIALGDNAVVIKSDAGKLADITRLVSDVSERFKTIDILFLNAGIGKFAPIEAVNEAVYDEVMGINLKGPYFTIQKMLPIMKDGGSIILNASVLASVGMTTTSVYSASKAALRSLSRTLAAETAARNIRINTISPGPISTPIYAKMGLPKEALDQMAKNISEQVPMKRFGNPDEVARAALFLASDDSSYTTGAEIFVDGGMGQL
jgi:NAD(P)-dependent dehydrogenase (short-subunit alcohol dehydrogenase family)